MGNALLRIYGVVFRREWGTHGHSPRSDRQSATFSCELKQACPITSGCVLVAHSNPFFHSQLNGLECYKSDQAMSDASLFSARQYACLYIVVNTLVTSKHEKPPVLGGVCLYLVSY